MRRIILVGALLLSFIFNINAQDQVYQVLARSGTASPRFVKINNGSSVDNEQFFKMLAAEFKFGINDLWLQNITESDKLGFTHLRFQHYYKGIAVDGDEYILHKKNNTLSTANGIATGLLNMPVKPSLSEKAALNNALKLLNEKNYRWEIKSEEKALKNRTHNKKATYFPKGTLMISPIFGDDSQTANYKLCWVFDIAGDGPDQSMENVYRCTYWRSSK